jgi:hypothetical protein
VWLSGSGALHDEDTGVWLVHNGLPAEENSPQGKWGVGFVSSFEAYQLWKRPGNQLWILSPRAIAMRLTLRDKDDRDASIHFVHGHAIQQDAGEALRDACYADLDKGLDAREKGDVVIFSTDCNCSIGARDGDERDQVRGRHGEPHRNAAGDFFHAWAGQRKLRAASTRFPRKKPRRGHGTWRHPRVRI